MAENIDKILEGLKLLLESQSELKKSQLKTDEQMKKNSEQSLIDTKDLNRQIKETNKQLGGMGRSQEEVGIDLFRRNMKPMMRKRGIEVDNISTRFKSAIKLEDGTMLQGEYDLMGINGKDIVVVEVKNKMRDDYITKFVDKQLPKFKTLFPQYKDYNLYGGIGGLIVGEHQEKKAEKAGLFVFTQGKDGSAVLMNKPDFEAKVF